MKKLVDIYEYQCQNCGCYYRRDEEKKDFGKCPSCGRSMVSFFRKMTYTKDQFRSAFDRKTFERYFGDEK